MHDILEESIVKVLFTKKNGELRTMFCTLREDIIPQTGNSKGPEASGLLVVYDLENEGWRSFYEDSIIEFEETEWPTQGEE